MMKRFGLCLFLVLLASCSGGPPAAGAVESPPPPTAQADGPAAVETPAPPPTATPEPADTPVPPPVIDAGNAGSLARTYRIQHSDVHSLMFDSGGAALLIGSGDPFRGNYSVTLWHPYREHKDQLVNAVAQVFDAAFSPDGKVVAYVIDQNSQDVRGRIIDPESGQPLEILTGTGTTHCLAFSPDGTLLAVGGTAGAEADGAVWIYETAGWEPVRELSVPGQTVLDLVFSPDGTRLYGAGSDGKIRVWTVADGKRLSTFQKGKEAAWIALSPDGAVLASVYCTQPGEFSCLKGGVSLWDTAQAKSIAVLADTARSLAFSPDGSLFFSGGDFGDPVIRIRRTEDWQVVATLDSMAAALALSGDGRRLAVADFEDVMIWSVP